MSTLLPSQYTFTYTGIGSSFYPIVFTPIEVAAEKPCYKDGCVCKKCKELFPYAEPNQPDKTLICWACRHNY